MKTKDAYGYIPRRKSKGKAARRLSSAAAKEIALKIKRKKKTAIQKVKIQLREANQLLAQERAVSSALYDDLQRINLAIDKFYREADLIPATMLGAERYGSCTTRSDAIRKDYRQ